MHTLNILLGEQSKIVAEEAKQSLPFDFIQTSHIQGRTIHHLKDLTVAQCFCDFFACPFFNSGSIPCLFDKNHMIAKERVNTILTPNLPDRAFFLGALNPHFKRIFSNTSTLNWAHFYANELIDSWKETIPLDGSEKEIGVNVQLGLSQILCRWGIKGFWGFSQNIDELHETALAILNSNFETKLPDVVLMRHQMKIKNIFQANIDHQRSMDDPLVSDLSEPEDKKCTAMIANYDANLSILHQTGTFLLIYLLRLMVINPAMQAEYRTIAIQAEKTFGPENWDAYIEALQPFEKLIADWSKHLHSLNWTATMPYAAQLKRGHKIHQLNRGDEVSWNPQLKQQTKRMHVKKGFFINSEQHCCTPKKGFDRILSVILSSILSKVELIPVESEVHPTCELSIVPKPKDPLIIKIKFLEELPSLKDS